MKALILSSMTALLIAVPALAGNEVVVSKCEPSAADNNRSGLETVVVKRKTIGCDQSGPGLHCFMMGYVYTAEVTVNVPFDNYVTQSFNVLPTGNPGRPGAPSGFEGKGFKLTFGPVYRKQEASLSAHLKAQDGYSAQDVVANVTCR